MKKCIKAPRRIQNPLKEIEQKNLTHLLEQRVENKRQSMPNNYVNYCQVLKKEAQKILKEHKFTNFKERNLNSNLSKKA